MKPAPGPQVVPDTPARVEFQVQFSGGPKGRCLAKKIESTASPEQESPATSVGSPVPEPVKRTSPNHVPKLTKLLVLGHHFEKLVREGVVRDYAEIARLTGLSRARVTQVASLTLLAPDMQERILHSSEMLTWREGTSITERNTRQITAAPLWKIQQRRWNSQE